MKDKSSLFPHLLYAGAILIVGLVLVGSFFYLRNKELKVKEEEFKAKQTQEQTDRQKTESEEKARQNALDECLVEVSSRFEAISKDPATRYQTSEGVKIILDQFDKQKEDCYKKYP